MTDLTIFKKETEDKFVRIISSVRAVDELTALQQYEVELFSYGQMLINVSDANLCTDLSRSAVFLEVISSGLSFTSNEPLVYLMTRNVKLKTKDGEKWEKRLYYRTSPDGKIHLAKISNAILDITKPTIVYEGDNISINNNVITYSPKIPRNEKIIGGFCMVYLPSGVQEAIWVDVKDMDRHKIASEKQNNGKANANYTSNNGQIDTGFFSSKIINIALKNKVKKINANTPKPQYLVSDEDEQDTLIQIDNESTF